MNNVSLDLKEQKILWSVLNQAQDIGLRSVGNLLTQYSNVQEAPNSMVADWVSQTQEEYNVINILKVKLCGDLE